MLIRSIYAQRLLLCEGKDEMEIIATLLKDKNLNEQYLEIVNVNGKDDFFKNYSAQFKRSGFENVKLVAFIFDSEEDSADRQSWAKEFSEIIEKSGRKPLAFQFPSASESGSIETLFRKRITEENLNKKCADSWEQCMKDQVIGQKKNQAQNDKAWLHVWMASYMRSSTYSRVGIAYSQSNDIKQALKNAVQPLEEMLDKILNESLV